MGADVEGGGVYSGEGEVRRLRKGLGTCFLLTAPVIAASNTYQGGYQLRIQKHDASPRASMFIDPLVGVLR